MSTTTKTEPQTAPDSPLEIVIGWASNHACAADNTARARYTEIVTALRADVEADKAKMDRARAELATLRARPSLTKTLDGIESDLSGIMAWTNHAGFNVPGLLNTDRQAQDTLWNIKTQLTLYERNMKAKIAAARAQAGAL